MSAAHHAARTGASGVAGTTELGLAATTPATRVCPRHAIDPGQMRPSRKHPTAQAIGRTFDRTFTLARQTGVNHSPKSRCCTGMSFVNPANDRIIAKHTLVPTTSCTCAMPHKALPPFLNKTLAVLGQAISNTVSRFGPCAPRTKMRSMSPVRLGPVMNEIVLG